MDWGVAQRRVPGEHRAVQPAQFVAGFEAELVPEGGAGESVRLERVARPVAAVLGHHQLGPQRFAQRVAFHLCQQLADEFPVFAEGEPGLGVVLEGGQPGLLQSCHLDLEGLVVRHPVERAAAPQRERLPQIADGSSLVAFRQRGPPPGHQVLEPVQVQLVGVHAQLVAAVAQAQPVLAGGGAEHPAQRGDVAADVGVGGGGRALPPDLVAEAVRGHGGVGVDQQCGEQGALFRPAERQRTAVRDGLEWPQHLELDARHLDPHDHPSPGRTAERVTAPLCATRTNTSPSTIG
ncbi:hypothetical protein RM609_03695 [Streptomyces sp. DSM 40473]|uniref:Uncharacterized protein n=1 Tax=Streptomyces hesseae TaxID=3075519 RepID=A0ABU2SGV7_9ACTN|nr:hypothetical protein [Streptomyces sp. DSM 40473]MDT0448208.1 hypothetical protein [Streptomyces sp. DSM 40473]